MSTCTDEAPVTASPLRRVLAWATDRRGGSWQVTGIIAVAYVGLWWRLTAVDQLQVSPLIGVSEALVTVLVQCAMLAAAHATVLGRRWWRWHSLASTAVVLTISILASALASLLVTTTIAPLTGEGSQPGGEGLWLQRAITLLIITAAWAGLDDYRHALIDQRIEQERLAGALEHGVAEVNAQRADVVSQVSTMLDDALVEMQRGHGSAEAMTALARERIRALSHSLATSMPAYTPPTVDIPQRSVARDALDRITTIPLASPLLMAIAVTVFFVGQTMSSPPPTDAGEMITSATITPTGDAVGVSVSVSSLLWGLLFLAVIFLSTWTAGVVAVRLLRRALPGMALGARVLWLVATPVLIALVVQTALQFVYIAQPDATALDRSLLERTVIAAPIFAIAILAAAIRGLVGLLDGVLQGRHDIVTALAWQVTRTRETLQQERDWLASELHGRVQSIVAATAIDLEREGGADGDAWSSAQIRLERALDTLMLGPQTRTTLQSHLDDLRLTWAGVCKVQADLDPDLVARIDADWVSQRTVMRIITDGVANSAMHGQAGHVHVLIMQEQPQEFLLMICDNGKDQGPAAAPGLGSLNLDTVALRWSLTLGLTGTGLSVTLPLPDDSPSRLVTTP